MRPLARYAFTATRGAPGTHTNLQEMSAAVQDWLRQKGWDGQAADFEVRGGRRATVERTETRSTSGQLDRWSISEPTEDGRTRFTTQLTLAESGPTLAVYCEFRPRS
jgi:hypothetical protein